MNQEEKFKSKFIEELEEQVWRKEQNIAFDLSKIPAVEALRDKHFGELDKLKGELAGLDANDKSRQTRIKRKELEKKIMAAEDFALNCDETITAIRDNTQKEKDRVEQLEMRIKFAREFKLTQNDGSAADKN